MPVSFGGGGLPLFPPSLTYSVEISFTPPYATPSWWDITEWCTDLKTMLGRNHELQQTVPSTCTLVLDNRDARFNPWNTTGPYAALGAGLVPQQPVRVIITWQGQDYPVFYGYVDSWIPKLIDPVSADIVITATDILGMLQAADLLSTAYSDQVTADNPAGYYRMNDPSGIICTDITGHGNTGFYQGAVNLLAQGALLGDPDAAVDLAGTGYITLPTGLAPTGNNPFTWELWVNLDQPAPTEGYAVVVANMIGNPQSVAVDIFPNYLQFYGYDPAGVLWCDMGTAPAVLDPGWHHVAATYDGNIASLYLDGTLAASQPAAVHAGLAAPSQFDVGAFPGSTFAPLDAKVDELAVYTYALSAAQIATHYNLGGFAYQVQPSGVRFQAVCTAAGIPAGLVYVPNAGDSMVQGATTSLVGTKVAEYMQTLRNTEQGELIQGTDGRLSFFNRHYVLTTATSTTSQATFEDAAGATFFYNLVGFTPGRDNLDLWNEVVGSAQPGPGNPPNPSGAPQVYRNAASIAQYGKRSYPSLTGLLTTSDAEVLSLVQWVGSLYSTPKDRVRAIQMDSAINAGGDLPQMLGRQFLDRITVIYHGGNGGTAFTQDSYIEGIEMQVTANPGLLTTTWHLSPANTAPYLILDDATLGLLDSGRTLAY